MLFQRNVIKHFFFQSKNTSAAAAITIIINCYHQRWPSATCHPWHLSPFDLPPSSFSSSPSYCCLWGCRHVSRRFLLGPSCWRGWGTLPSLLGVVNRRGGVLLPREPAVMGYKQPRAVSVIGWLIRSFISVELLFLQHWDTPVTHLRHWCLADGFRRH